MTPPRNRSLTEQGMDYVRHAVGTGEMVAGAWYSVYQLSAVLGISRSPVREGLLRLEEAGLVRFARNRGFQIVTTTPVDIAEIFALRLGIEPAAAYRAALHRTEEELTELSRLTDLLADAANKHDEHGFFAHDRALHALILQAGGSTRGVRFVEQLRTHTGSPGDSPAGASRILWDILDEHSPILAAIRRRDAESARRAMTDHLRSTGRLLLARSLAVAEDDTDPVVWWERYAAGS